MILRRTILFSLCIVAGLITISCSSNAGQNDFERQSLLAPSGYTHTNQNGQVDSSMVDPDDWRIAPMFQSFVYVSVPAYPNPVKSGIVRIELQVTGIQAINGMYLYKRNVNGQYQLLASQPQAPLPTGLICLFVQFSGIVGQQQLQPAPSDFIGYSYTTTTTT